MISKIPTSRRVLPLLALAACAQLLPVAAAPATFRTFLTAKDIPEARLKEQPVTPLAKDPNPGFINLFVNPTRQFQTIEGFGGAFTESAAVTWKKMSPANQKEIIAAYFDTNTGLGYSFCRTHINSADFSTSNYAYDETPGDTKLEHFSIDRDKQALIPMIKAAQAASRTPFKLFASPWSPPAWMKTNGQMNNGGRLKPEYRQAWADYFVRYLAEYKKEGIPIWGLTSQNEPEAVSPWDNCLYSPVEQRDFIRDFLGPTLARSPFKETKIMNWDHNGDDMIEDSSILYADPEAAKYVWGTGYHWYAQGCLQNVQLHHDAWPSKPVLLTEACQDNGAHIGDWGSGERYATSIVADLNRWSIAWIDWNIVLDETGGPNHAGNFCSAPIIADTKNDKLLYQNSYYYFGHFVRFMRPGSKRILCASSADKLEATATVSPDGTVSIVVLNRTNDTLRFNLKGLNSATQMSLQPHAIATYLVSAKEL